VPTDRPRSNNSLRSLLTAGAVAAVTVTAPTAFAASEQEATGTDATTEQEATGTDATTQQDAEQPAPTEAQRPAKAKAADTQPARLRLAHTNPRKTFFDHRRRAAFHFEMRGKRKRDLVVRVKKLSSGKTMKRWRLKNVPPKQRQTVRWNGKRQKGGFTGQGRHVFKVSKANGQKADKAQAEGKSRFRYFNHHFPLPAKHTYGDGFGAGRGHQGVDIFAPCGKKIRAARGGRVKTRAYHGAAGYYVVVAGRKTGRDYVYMHLQKKGRPKLGARVRTGEVIGRNGETGNASGCHLHFEVWSSPGWYDGGRPLRNVKKMVQRWDTWS
jgi:murein DD-endopeptidase MepM/ murein hydrolase activator NlpD